MTINLIDEQTTKEQLTEEYKSYPKVGGSLEEKPFYEHRYAPIFYEIPIGSKVLDAGCNDGIFLQMVKEKRKCDVTGIDISEVALEEAKKRGLNVLNADIENLPFEDGSFDVVLCMEVLSHLFDPSRALKEIRRVLKKDGIMLGSCPHKNIETYAWEDNRKHRRYFDQPELHKLISEQFERTGIQVLTGAQFSMSMSTGFLAQEPCEMLFKSGNIKTTSWDSALLDRSILRCWFGFTQGPGVVYYRMSGFADKMQKMGAEVHYDPYRDDDLNDVSSWTRKIKYLPSERRFTNAHIVNELDAIFKSSDMSVFQLTSSRDILLLLSTARDRLGLRKGYIPKPLYFECDDWIFDLPSYNYASSAYHPNSEVEAVAYDQIKLSDGGIVSTNYLRDKLLTLFPDKPIYVVKNALDFDIWDKLEKKVSDHANNPNLIRIGYTGCSNHNGDLEVIKKPILALLDEFPNLEFISIDFELFKDVKHPRLIKWNQWVPLSQFPQLANMWEMDFGIAPLRDNELNRAKSNLRWLEYSALKIPTIASKVEPFNKSITDGKDGILVGNSEKSWYEAMREMIMNKEKRDKIGSSAYVEVRKNYDMEKVAKTYLSILKTIKQEFFKGKGRLHESLADSK